MQRWCFYLFSTMDMPFRRSSTACILFHTRPSSSSLFVTVNLLFLVVFSPRSVAASYYFTIFCSSFLSWPLIVAKLQASSSLVLSQALGRNNVCHYIVVFLNVFSSSKSLLAFFRVSKRTCLLKSS